MFSRGGCDVALAPDGCASKLLTAIIVLFAIMGREIYVPINIAVASASLDSHVSAVVNRRKAKFQF